MKKGEGSDITIRAVLFYQATFDSCNARIQKRLKIVTEAFGDDLLSLASSDTVSALQEQLPSLIAGVDDLLREDRHCDWVWLVNHDNFLAFPGLDISRYLKGLSRGIYHFSLPGNYAPWSSVYNIGTVVDIETFRELYSEFAAELSIADGKQLELDISTIKMLQLQLYEVSPGPYMAVIENTSFCNLKCTMCPFHSDELKESSPVFVDSGQVMPTELYRRAVDEMADMIGVHPVADPWIISSVRGEILLDADYYEKIEYALNKGLNFNVYTNGALLSEKIILELLDLEVTQLTVSLDSLTDEMGQNIRPGSCPSSIATMLEILISEKLQRGITKPRLILTYTDTGKNSGERESFLKYWEHKADAISMHYAYSFKGKSALFEQKYDGFSEVARDICYSLLNSVVILSDGQIQPCCMTGDYAETLLGNLHSDSLVSAFKSEKKRQLLDAHLMKNFTCCDTCSACELWMYAHSWSSVSDDNGEYWDTVNRGPIDISYSHTTDALPQAVSWWEKIKRKLKP